MKPTITKVKNLRGRITGYRAAIGPVEREGKTAKEAAQACEQAALEALGRLDNGSEIKRWRDRVYIVIPTTEGWKYWMDGFCSDYFVGPYQRHEDANGAALHHLAQNLWDHDQDDATFGEGLPPKVRADVEQWIRFQRAYKLHKAAGRTDNECHRLACEDSYRRAS